jgi:hypothetical protein
MKRTPIEILHCIDHTDYYWLQVRYQKAREAEALTTANHRAVSAGWDPVKDVKHDVTTETRNWRTVERWHHHPLDLKYLLTLNAEDLDDDQALVRFDNDRVRRMVTARNDYDQAQHPLFAAAGALDEICQAPASLAYLLQWGNDEMKSVVLNAAFQQESWHLQGQVKALLGVQVTEELRCYAVRTYPSNPAYLLNHWREVLRDPERKVAQVRKIAELQTANAARRAALESAS